MTKDEVIAKIREEYASGRPVISPELTGEMILTMAKGDKISASEILDELTMDDLIHTDSALRALLTWVQQHGRAKYLGKRS